MNRLSLLCFALALPLAATACGGSDDEGEGGGPVEGDHYQYVVGTIDPDDTNKLDIDGNGTPENKVGSLVATLSLFFDVQEAIDDALLRGAAILLVDVQTSSLSVAANAGASFYLGDAATAQPAPCTDATMISTCGKHLQGSGSFSLSATSPRDTTLAGKFSGGTYTTNKNASGKLAVQIALTGAPIVVNLVGARAQIQTVTADGIGKGIIGGAITETELNNNVFPSIKAQLDAVIERDCGPAAGRTGGTCSCAADSTGLAVLRGPAPFDFTTPVDCQVSLAELKGHPLLDSTLKSDVMVDGAPAISVALGFTAKKATFTAP